MTQYRRIYRSFWRHWRAYFAMPAALTCEHDEQLYWLARSMAHEAMREGLLP